MNDKDKSAEQKASSDIEEKASNIGNKLLGLATKKFTVPSFSVPGWGIAIAAVVLLILIFK